MYRYHLAPLFIMTSKDNCWEVVLDIFEVLVIFKNLQSKVVRIMKIYLFEIDRSREFSLSHLSCENILFFTDKLDFTPVTRTSHYISTWHLI